MVVMSSIKMNIEWSPAKLVTVCAVAIIGAFIGLALRDGLDTSTRTGAAKVAPTPSPSPPEPVQLYGLAIPAQRERTYPGSKVTVETAPEARDGYRESLLSYRSDGLKIFTQALLPTTPAPAGGYPTIILIHGYVQPDRYETGEAFYTAFAADYARRGFAVLKPDLRGHSRSWGVPEGAYYSAGYVADVLNLAASIPGYAPANPKGLTLFAHSMGGHVALEALLVRPLAFTAAVIAAGSVGQIGDMYYNWTAFSDFGSPVTLGIRKRVISLFGEPNDGDAFWKQTDPYTFLGELKTPVLLAHSEADDTVPYRFSTELAAAALAAKAPVSLSTYAGTHSFDGDVRIPFIDETSAFATSRRSDR